MALVRSAMENPLIGVISSGLRKVWYARAERPSPPLQNPALWFPYHRVSRHTSLCHRHSAEGDYSSPELGICTVGVGLPSTGRTP